MQISKHTDYALRTLMYLGLKNPVERCSIREISDAFGISHNHLMKVVQKLSAASLVDGQRGKGGGIRLAKPPAEINIGQVVRAFESGKPVVNCALGPCRFESSCKLELAINRAMQAFLASLCEHTLADVLANRDQLVQALNYFEKAPVSSLR